MTRFLMTMSSNIAITEWDTYHDNEMEAKGKLLSADELTKVVSSPAFPKRGTDAQGRALLKKYQSHLKALVSGFRYAKGPVQYADHLDLFSGDGKTCLHICAIVDGNVYNSLRMNAHQRAAEVFGTYVPPLARQLVLSLKAPKDIPLYAITIVYGSKDFSDDSPLATRAEAILVVAASRDWTLLHEGTITDQQFASRSDVFLFEAGVSTERRIDIRLGG